MLLEPGKDVNQNMHIVLKLKTYITQNTPVFLGHGKIYKSKYVRVSRTWKIQKKILGILLEHGEIHDTKYLGDLSFLEEEDAEPMSKKDEMKLAKENAKKAKKQENEEKKLDSVNNEEKKKNKALEQLEQLERDMAKSSSSDSDGPKLSKKELKALKKKEEKEALKKEKKSLKMKERADSQVEAEAEEQETESEQERLLPVNTKPGKLTSEERIRKDRPPPQIKIIQTAQPDFLSL